MRRCAFDFGLFDFHSHGYAYHFDGISRYSAVDNDVATFGCIVRSEVDEEFRLVGRAQFIRRNSA